MRSNYAKVFFVLFSLLLIRANAQSHHFYGHYAHPHVQCLKKICEQTITGRGLPYTRILHIIHSREYLNAIALDKMPSADSKRHKRQAEGIVAESATSIFNGNSPLLMAGVPLLILSAMFLASLRRQKHLQELEEESYTIVESPPEIIYDTPPPPIIPNYVPKPGQPGGGYAPDPIQHHKILSLVPYGLQPVAVFPSHFHYGGLTGYTPTECVVFTEPDPFVNLPYFSYDPYRKKRKVKRSLRKGTKRRIMEKNGNEVIGRKQFHHLHHPQPLIDVPVYEPLFGFTCLVTVIDKKTCNSPEDCRKIKDFEAVYGQGYFFQKDVPPLYPSFNEGSPPKVVPYANPLYYDKRTLSKRAATLSAKGEFHPDDLPQCRIQDSPYSLECSDKA